MKATSKDSDQTARMRRLIWGFAGRTYLIVRGSYDVRIQKNRTNEPLQSSHYIAFLNS